MDDQALHQLMKQLSHQQRPSRWFGFKLRLRLYGKAFHLNFMPSHHAAALVSSTQRPRLAFKFVGVTLVVLLFCGSGISVYAYASPEVDATSPLYPVKEGIENVEYSLAVSPHDKATVRMKHALRRAAEAEELAHKMRVSERPLEEEEGMNRTLAKMQIQMEESFDALPDEDDLVPAKRLVTDLQDSVEQMDQNLNQLEIRASVQEQQMLQNRLEQIHVATQNKLLRMQAANSAIQSAMDERRQTIRLRVLLRQERQEELSSGENDRGPVLTTVHPLD